jgi:hypothetical protein
VCAKTTFLLCLAILGIIAAMLAIMPGIRHGRLTRPLSVQADIYGLVQKDDGTNWRGPYLDQLMIDPWGHSYVYTYPGRHNTNAYDLVSAGPDGRLGTADDIGNWTK